MLRFCLRKCLDCSFCVHFWRKLCLQAPRSVAILTKPLMKAALFKLKVALSFATGAFGFKGPHRFFCPHSRDAKHHSKSNCRERHLKCDGGPLCSRCKTQGVTCVLSHPVALCMAESQPKTTKVQVLHKNFCNGCRSGQYNGFHLQSQRQFYVNVQGLGRCPWPRFRLHDQSLVCSPNRPVLFLVLPYSPLHSTREHLAEKLETRDLHYL